MCSRTTNVGSKEAAVHGWETKLESEVTKNDRTLGRSPSCHDDNPNNIIAVEASQADSQPMDQDDSSPRQMSGWKWVLISSTVLFATLLMALDNTVVADLQPRIVEALGEISKFPWINVSFSLGSVASSLLWGKMYAMFEAKMLFITAVIVFEIGCAICGAAPSMDALIIGRTVTGIGGNGLYLGAMNIVSAFTSQKERPLYFSFFGISWGGGTVLGPVIGGLFAQSRAGWRWAFYFNIVAGVIIVPIYVWLVPIHHPEGADSGNWIDRIRRVDFLGFILFAGGFTCFVMAVSFGGAKYDWRSGQIIGLFTCFIVLAMLLALQQGRRIFTTEEDRVLPVSVLQRGEMLILVGQTAASVSILFIGLNYLPIFLQFVRSETALRAAVELLPLIFTAVVFMLITGSFLERYGYYAAWYLVGSLIAVAGTALMRTVHAKTPHANVYGYSVLFSAGVSLYVQASWPVAQAKVAPEKASDAVTVIGCTQLGAIASSLAIANSIFVNRATVGIQEVLPDVAITDVQAAISGVGASIFEGLPQGKKERILQAVAAATQDVWTQTLATAVFSVVLTVFMNWQKKAEQK
ncbi:MAG: hypothetical protein M1831_006190 [Alyxoria varia]|nr:MAG: hypothetical protein M1831_006190 [Alyxoria varia]